MGRSRSSGHSSAPTTEAESGVGESPNVAFPPGAPEAGAPAAEEPAKVEAPPAPPAPPEPAKADKGLVAEAPGAGAPPAPAKAASKAVKAEKMETIIPNFTDARVCIGKKWYSFVAGKQQTVPENVAQVLRSRKMLAG